MTDDMGKLLAEARIKAEITCDCPECIRYGRHDEQCSLCGDIYDPKNQVDWELEVEESD